MNTIKILIKVLISIFYILVVLVLTWLNIIRYGGNFHSVAPGVYRSAQLYYYDLPKYYNRYHFKTILNLRGAYPKSKWYIYEKTFCKEHNITLINFRISARKIQSIKTMQKLIKIMKNAKKPLLIHCQAGADRSGLVSALYLYSIGDKNYSKMLSIKYGHFPYFGSSTKAMDLSLKKFIKYSKSH